MPGIDAHQHFWRFEPERDVWISDEMRVLRRDFMPADLEPLLNAAGMEGCVLIQAQPADAGNAFLLEIAEANDFVKGVVGWTDLCHPDIDARLESYRQYSRLKGFRPMLQGDVKRDAMLRPEFMRGVAALTRHGYSMDLLVQPDQLPFVHELVNAFPQQAFVIDHLAKPDLRTGELSGWGSWMQRIARAENVLCKVSGMVTEADWSNWRAADFVSVLDLVSEAFGPGRLMFGSDWPVCLLAAAYSDVHQLAWAYFHSFSSADQDAIFGGNARRFYNL